MDLKKICENEKRTYYDSENKLFFLFTVFWIVYIILKIVCMKVNYFLDS